VRPAILALKGVLVTALPDELTDHDIAEFQGEMLRAVERRRARGLVVDISALEILDTYLARSICETAEMARLLGTEVVVCGMRPAVALTLVEMGQELVGIETALDLDGGLAAIEELIARRTRALVD